MLLPYRLKPTAKSQCNYDDLSVDWLRDVASGQPMAWRKDGATWEPEDVEEEDEDDGLVYNEADGTFTINMDEMSRQRNL